MADIKITLETLYDFLRNEKKREDLQSLEDTFFIDVISYLREKKTLLDSKKDEDELFAAGEKDKLEYELRSIKRILKELYEKREKKIIDIALNRSRTGSDIIDTSAMLREEKDFYAKLLIHLNLYRRGILLNLYKGELPNVIGPGFKQVSVGTKKTETPAFDQFEETEESEELDPGPTEEQDHQPEVAKESSEQEPSEPEPSKETSKIKFIRPMPSFVWKDMKVYGPFDQGEETEIFTEVADLIVRKGRAEKV